MGKRQESERRSGKEQAQAIKDHAIKGRSGLPPPTDHEDRVVPFVEE